MSFNAKRYLDVYDDIHQGKCSKRNKTTKGSIDLWMLLEFCVFFLVKTKVTWTTIKYNEPMDTHKHEINQIGVFVLIPICDIDILID